MAARPASQVHNKGYESFQRSLSGEKKMGKLKEVRITMAENGYSVECVYQPPKSNNKKESVPMDYDSNRKTKVFESLESLTSFLKQAL